MLLPNDNLILNEKGSGCPRDNVGYFNSSM